MISFRLARHPHLSLAWPRLQRRVRIQASAEDWLLRGMLCLAFLWLAIALILPLMELLWRSVADRNGAFVGLANYYTYFTTPALSRSLTNSLLVAGAAAFIATLLGFVYAYTVVRTQAPGRRVLLALAMLPLFMPSLVHAISLVYLFGNKGVITTGFFGFFAERWGFNPAFNINLYGATGILIGEVLYCFPQAVLILSVALSIADGRLYEAARTLDAGRLRIFLTVTLPAVKHALISAFILCFSLAFTDFGIPKVVGGRFNVLATDVYKQVVGQQNFAMGATVSLLLLLPTALAFGIDALVRRRQLATLTARAVPYQPRRNGLRDWLLFGFCTVLAAVVLSMLAVALVASLATVWPYNLTPTLRHYTLSGSNGGGYATLWNSIRLAVYSAVAGTVAVFAGAYLVEKSRTLRPMRSAIAFLSTLPAALPGLVIGISYVFFFNRPGWQFGDLSLPNVFQPLYGTMAILVLANVVHFYTVAFTTATTALKQLDSEFESVAASLSVPFYVTFWRVTLPICLPALLEIGLYFFVNSMATVSALIFLYGPSLRPAAVAVVNLDDAGDGGAAAALALLVVGISIAARLVTLVATRNLRRRTQAWLGA